MRKGCVDMSVVCNETSSVDVLFMAHGSQCSANRDTNLCSLYADLEPIMTILTYIFLAIISWHGL